MAIAETSFKCVPLVPGGRMQSFAGKHSGIPWPFALGVAGCRAAKSKHCCGEVARPTLKVIGWGS